MPFHRKPPPGNVRRVISLGNNFRGVTTNKRGHLVQFESEQERKLILLLERDVTVADYISQPETLRFLDPMGRARHYTPDFQVWRINGQIELHEVTITQRRPQREASPLREAAAELVCMQRGWSYVVHTEQTLPSGYAYVNLDCLAAFRVQTYANAEYTAWWLDHLAQRGPVHPRAVLDQVPSTFSVPHVLTSLYHLLWHDRVHMDWQEPFLWRGTLHLAARIWHPTTPTCQPEVQG